MKKKYCFESHSGYPVFVCLFVCTFCNQNMGSLANHAVFALLNNERKRRRFLYQENQNTTFCIQKKEQTPQKILSTIIISLSY